MNNNSASQFDSLMCEIHQTIGLLYDCVNTDTKNILLTRLKEQINWVDRFAESFSHHLPPVKTSFTTEEAIDIAKALCLDFGKEQFDNEQFRMGLDVELEHGRIHCLTDVTGDDPILTGKTALAHLMEFPDYYTRLKKLEDEAKAYWEERQ